MTSFERPTSPSAPPPSATASILLVSPSTDRLSEARRVAASMLACSDDEAGKVTRGTHPDVLELLAPEGKERIGILQIREVIRSAQFAPSQAPFKVCVIPFAEALTVEAANALLKILEEPPRGLRFALFAEHPSDLLPTIVSRSRLVRASSSLVACHERLIEAGYESSDAERIARLPLHGGELERLLGSPRNLLESATLASERLAAADTHDILEACLGDDPVVRRQGMLCALDRVATRNPDLLTEGVRILANQDREVLDRFLRDLLIVGFDLVRDAFRPSQRRDDLADRVRASFGVDRLRSFCLAVDRSHRSLAVYGPVEGILVSLFLAREEPA